MFRLFIFVLGPTTPNKTKMGRIVPFLSVLQQIYIHNIFSQLPFLGIISRISLLNSRTDFSGRFPNSRTGLSGRFHNSRTGFSGRVYNSRTGLSGRFHNSRTNFSGMQISLLNYRTGFSVRFHNSRTGFSCRFHNSRTCY